MKIELLTRKSHQKLKDLITTVDQYLNNPEMLIVLTKEEIENIFNNKNAMMYGLFENDELVSISGLFFDESDFYDIVKLLNIENTKVAEIAECMTLPKARGNNYMLKINQVLLNRAKELGVDYLIATAHPDNISSNKSLTKLGMQCNGQFYRYGKYLRNYYVIKV